MTCGGDVAPLTGGFGLFRVIAKAVQERARRRQRVKQCCLGKEVRSSEAEEQAVEIKAKQVNDIIELQMSAITRQNCLRRLLHHSIPAELPRRVPAIPHLVL